MAVFFYWGQEDFNIERAINEKKKLLDKNFASMNFKTYNNPIFADFISILRTQAMMFGKLLIVINCFEMMSKTFEGKELEEIKSALDLASENETTDIILCAQTPRDGSKKLDGRKKITKLFQKYNSQEFPIIPSYKIDEIINWIRKEAKSKKLIIEDDAAMAIFENLGNELRLMSGEIEKLELLAYPDKKITKKMVKEICITSEDFFNITGFLMKGERDKAFIELVRLLDKKHILEIIAAIQTMLRKWINIKILSSKKIPASAIGAKIGMHEFVVKKNIETMRNLPLKDFVDLKKGLTNAEYRIKAGLATDEILEVQNVFIR